MRYINVHLIIIIKIIFIDTSIPDAYDYHYNEAAMRMPSLNMHTPNYHLTYINLLVSDMMTDIPFTFYNSYNNVTNNYEHFACCNAKCKQNNTA